MTKKDENITYHFIGIGELGKMVVEQIHDECSCEWIKNPSDLAANADMILQQHSHGYELIVEYDPEWDTYLNNPQILGLLHHADLAVIVLHQSLRGEIESADQLFLQIFGKIPKVILCMKQRNRMESLPQMQKGISGMIRSIYAPGYVCFDIEDIAIPEQNNYYGMIYHTDCNTSKQMPGCAKKLINHAITEINPQDIHYIHIFMASDLETELGTLTETAIHIEDALTEDTKICWSHVSRDQYCEITIVLYLKMHITNQNTLSRICESDNIKDMPF